MFGLIISSTRVYRFTLFPLNFFCFIILLSLCSLFIFMEMEPVILDISSDEDEDWLSELLGRVNADADDFDDVVVVDEEVSYASTIQKQRYVSSHAIKGTCDLSDDDCLILDGDPDNPVAVVDDSGNGTDDLLIVGEKGQLACRDYPHPRHLCAKFPFKSTPHDKHCDLCHCYVCDILAPCIHWGTGVSSTDHCHSTDKEEIWRVQRKCFKQGTIATPPTQNIPDTTLSITLPHHISEHVPPFPGSISPGLSHPLQSSVAKPRQLPAFSTGFSAPNIISHRHNQRSRPVPRIHRLPHANRSQQLTHGQNFINKERGGGSTVGLQPVASHLKFKRVGSSGKSFTAVNQSGYGQSNSLQMCTPTLPGFQNPQVTQSEDIWQNLLASFDSSQLDTFHDSSHPFSNNDFTDQLHAQSPPYDQPLPQSNAYQNQNTYQSGNPSTPNATNPDLLDTNFNWFNATSNSVPQHLSAADLMLPSVQPSGSSAISQHHPTSSESWIYTLDHPLVTHPVLSELGFSPPEPETVDPAIILFELGMAANGV